MSPGTVSFSLLLPSRKCVEGFRDSWEHRGRHQLSWGNFSPKIQNQGIWLAWTATTKTMSHKISQLSQVLVTATESRLRGLKCPPTTSSRYRYHIFCVKSGRKVSRLILIEERSGRGPLPLLFHSVLGNLNKFQSIALGRWLTVSWSYTSRLVWIPAWPLGARWSSRVHLQSRHCNYTHLIGLGRLNIKCFK